MNEKPKVRAAKKFPRVEVVKRQIELAKCRGMNVAAGVRAGAMYGVIMPGPLK